MTRISSWLLRIELDRYIPSPAHSMAMSPSYSPSSPAYQPTSPGMTPGLPQYSPYLRYFLFGDLEFNII